MYMKSSASDHNTYRIPENYSGNAFHGSDTEPTPPIILPPEPAEPTRSETAKEGSIPAVLSLEASAPEHHPPSPLLPPRLDSKKCGLLGDVGLEELLIIGLLFLLSQSETDDDILLLLMLLLFYK